MTLADIRERPFFWGSLGLATISAIISFGYGLAAWGVFPAVGLVIAAYGSTYLWPEVAKHFRDGAPVAASMLMAFAVLFTAMDVRSNLGAMQTKRIVDIQDTNVQNTRYDDQRDNVEELKARETNYRQQIDGLQARTDWQPTQTADAYRAEIARFEGDLIFGPTRTKGCTDATLADSRAFCAEWASAKAGLANAEALTLAKLELAATQDALRDVRSQAAVVDKDVSVAASENLMFASIATLTLEPDEEALQWANMGLGFMMALFFTFGAMGFAIAHVLSSPTTVASGSTSRRSSRNNATSPQMSTDTSVHALQDHISDAYNVPSHERDWLEGVGQTPTAATHNVTHIHVPASQPAAPLVSAPAQVAERPLHEQQANVVTQWFRDRCRPVRNNSMMEMDVYEACRRDLQADDKPVPTLRQFQQIVIDKALAFVGEGHEGTKYGGIALAA